jgi:hypothetical protein
MCCPNRAPLAWTTVLAALLLLVGNAFAAPAPAPECRQQAAQREQQCQGLAEKRAELCPEGQSGADASKAAECRKISEQIGDLCTRNPCGSPKSKAKTKRSKTPAKSKAKSTTKSS